MEHKKADFKRKINHIISAPFIWILIIPLTILDIFVEIYHRICFPLYGLPYIKRKSYIRIWDRPQLKYLNFFDKIACAYCGYANGWLHYASVIAAKTEKYWCGIKHKRYKGFIPNLHEKEFLEYGNEKQYRKFIMKK
ncbi:MAG: hypothetical protein QW041_02825 [Candidatus Pacearchaeota archaeon]